MKDFYQMVTRKASFQSFSFELSYFYSPHYDFDLVALELSFKEKYSKKQKDLLARDLIKKLHFPFYEQITHLTDDVSLIRIGKFEDLKKAVKRRNTIVNN